MLAVVESDYELSALNLQSYLNAIDLELPDIISFKVI